MMKNWKQGVAVALAALGIMVAGVQAADGDLGSPESMIGAKVVGSGGYSHLGEIVGLARGGPNGPVEMYVVKATGLFGGRGVIPLSRVTDELMLPEKDGSRTYRVEVSVNKATFRNIATLRGDEPLSSYLSRMDSILGTVYGLEEATLETFARNLVIDEGSAESKSKSSVATL